PFNTKTPHTTPIPYTTLFRSKYDKAEPLFQKALKLFEEKLGPNHYKAGAALDNLGALYREKGEYKKAESYGLRAVEVTEKARGRSEEHTSELQSRVGSVCGLL